MTAGFGDFGLGVSGASTPWFIGPFPHLGNFGAPFGEFPSPGPLPPPAPTPISFTMVKPLHIDFEHWASTLTVDFQSDFVPVPPQEASWRKWAWDLINSPTFYNQNAPFPDERFENWRAWAEVLYDVMVPSNIGPN